MALSKEEVEAQLRAIGRIGRFDSFRTERGFSHLPGAMREGEEILFMISGSTDGYGGLITATNMRVLFLGEGIICGSKLIECPYEKISAISHETGLMSGEIIISTFSSDVKFATLDRADVPKMAETISNRINAVNAKMSNIPALPPADGMLAKLERLAALKEKGLRTDAEFAEAKAKLIS